MVSGDGRAREQKPPHAHGVQSSPSLWDLGVCLGMSSSLGHADFTTEAVTVRARGSQVSEDLSLFHQFFLG